MRYDKQKGWFYNQHSCFLLQYHLIFVTKYRHPVLTGEVKEFVYSYPSGPYRRGERIRLFVPQRKDGSLWPECHGDERRTGPCPYPV